MEWRDIPNFDGYQVSNTGKVRTHNKVTFTEHHGYRHWKDRVLVPKVGINKRNRGDERVDLWKDGKPHTFIIARLEAFTFFGGDISDSTITVNHKDGNFNNNNLDNLELISLADNIRHGFENGLYSSAVSVAITNKQTGETNTYKSLSAASRYVGKYPGYVSGLFRRGKSEDKLYRYEKL